MPVARGPRIHVRTQHKGHAHQEHRSNLLFVRKKKFLPWAGEGFMLTREAALPRTKKYYVVLRIVISLPPSRSWQVAGGGLHGDT